VNLRIHFCFLCFFLYICECNFGCCVFSCIFANAILDFMFFLVYLRMQFWILGFLGFQIVQNRPKSSKIVPHRLKSSKIVPIPPVITGIGPASQIRCIQFWFRLGWCLWCRMYGAHLQSWGFYVFIVGFTWVNLRKIQKEAAGPGPGRTWAGPGPGPPPLFGFFVFLPVLC